jgi:dienelactone hydrolase
MAATPSGRRLVAVKPIPVPNGRGDLHVKVTAPTDGKNLPVLVFSHGHGWSMDGYEPLTDWWAAAGFVVLQPSHLDSRRNHIGLHDAQFASIWRVRIADLHAVLDHLGDILTHVDGLISRVDQARVAVAGHSWGSQTAGALLGTRVLDADGAPGEDHAHPAVRAGALLGATGTGDALTPFAAQHFPFLHPDFSTMTTPALVIAGSNDQSAMSTRGPDWFTDAYHLSPAPKTLLTITDGEHTLGGIAGEAVKETTDENPARVALVADAVAGYLLDALGVDPARWQTLQRNATASPTVLSITHK